MIAGLRRLNVCLCEKFLLLQSLVPEQTKQMLHCSTIELPKYAADLITYLPALGHIVDLAR